MDAEFLEGIDSYDKYIKVVRAATQSLWSSILALRAGKLTVKDIEPVAEMLRAILEVGEARCYPLPSTDQWWSEELLQAYCRIV